MPSADGAIERLYEDADVRDELRDDEANTLLKWAEDRLNQLAAQSATDDEFDAKAGQFRNLLKGMNRLVGNRATLDAAALNARLSDLSAQAASVATGGQPTAQAAPPLPADQLKAVAGKLPSLDDAGAVNALTALFTPGALTPSSRSSLRSDDGRPKDADPLSPSPSGREENEPQAAPKPNTPPAQEASEPSSASTPAQPVRGRSYASAQAAPKTDAAPAVKASEPTAESAPTEQAQPNASAQAALAQAGDEDDGLLHRFSIHFWHPRKKTPPQ